MPKEQMPQENGANPHPYLEELREMAERIYQREKRERAGERGYISTTSAIVSSINAELRRLDKLEEDYSPVTMERATLEQAMSPFVSLANILTDAGYHGVDLDAGDVGNVLGALTHYACRKTNGFPSLGECY